MFVRNLTNITKTILVDPGTAAGTTKITESTTIDTHGFNGLRIVATIGTVTATGKVELSANMSPDNSTWVPVAGSGGGGALNTTTSNSTLILDIHRPTNRYIQVILDRTVGAANVVITAVHAELYNPDIAPATQDTSTAATVILSEPLTGTI